MFDNFYNLLFSYRDLKYRNIIKKNRKFIVSIFVGLFLSILGIYFEVWESAFISIAFIGIFYFNVMAVYSYLNGLDNIDIEVYEHYLEIISNVLNFDTEVIIDVLNGFDRENLDQLISIEDSIDREEFIELIFIEKINLIINGGNK